LCAVTAVARRHGDIVTIEREARCRNLLKGEMTRTCLVCSSTLRQDEAECEACEVRQDGGEPMTSFALQQACREANGPQSKLATTRLYLTCHRFGRISRAIGEYPGVQVLNLEHNKLRRAEHLELLPDLQVLFLHKNRISRMEGLSMCRNLQMLSLSQNLIARIQGIAGLPSLHTLLLAENKVAAVEDIEELAECESLSKLDLSDNQLCDVTVLDTLCAMPALRVLALSGNPVANASDPNCKEKPVLEHYRKVALARLPELRSLDHKAVGPHERRYVNSWWRTKDRPRSAALEATATDDDKSARPSNSDIPISALHALAECLPDARAVLAFSLVSRLWRHAAAARLKTLARTAHARARAKANKRLAEAPSIGELTKADFAEFKNYVHPPTAVLHLVHAISVLWDQVPKGANWHVGAIPDLDSQTWRNHAWELGLHVMNSAEFPTALEDRQAELHTDACLLARVRAASGSADDLETYVPLLDERAARRACVPAGKLATWLLAVIEAAFCDHIERGTLIALPG